MTKDLSYESEGAGESSGERLYLVHGKQNKSKTKDLYTIRTYKVYIYLLLLCRLGKGCWGTTIALHWCAASRHRQIKEYETVQEECLSFLLNFYVAGGSAVYPTQRSPSGRLSANPDERYLWAITEMLSLIHI